VLIVPTVLLPPLTPSTDHTTLELDCPLTVAWNCCTAPVNRVSVPGVIATFPCTVTVALADLVVSAAAVAVTMCVPACCGAV
jgi:hypothetical protein